MEMPPDTVVCTCSPCFLGSQDCLNIGDWLVASLSNVEGLFLFLEVGVLQTICPD
jgi:hypothetical protein